MTIFLKRGDFLFQIFPDLKATLNDEELVKAIQHKYATSTYTPSVELKDGLIEVRFEMEKMKDSQHVYKAIVKEAEKGDFKKAKELITEEIEKGCSNSDIYRIYGQILSEEGDQEEGINQLIEALKWNPNNTNALLMMGNIYASFKKDIDTAEIFYRKVIELEPNNYIALNNIAGLIAKEGDLNKTLEYFQKSYQLNPKYPNTLYGMALTYFNQGEYLEAFEKTSSALKLIYTEKNRNKALEDSCASLQMESAKYYLQATNEEQLFQTFLKDLEQKSSKEIEVIIDDNIPTAAKIEIAEYRNRPNHVIRYKKSAKGYAHLVFHELTHLELIMEARKENENYLFTSSHNNENAFFRKAEKDKKKMLKGGLPEANFKIFLTKMFEGINLQMYNAPIDLFIEQRLYDRYKQLRPIQFLSLLQLQQQAIAGANNSTAKKISPTFLRDANIILTFTHLLQFQELFGTNLIHQIKEPILLNKAKAIYKDYLKMKDDKGVGEEYDLLKWWAEDLNLTPYFTLVQESVQDSAQEAEVEKSEFKFAEDIIAEIENDPYNFDADTTFEDQQMKRFTEANRKQGTNMAVTMYMANALQYFSNQPVEKAKAAGFEIAELGRLGIDPNGKDTYHLSAIPNNKFTGWKLLAFMYVSWSIFDPSMLSQLQLDFDKEFELAKTLV